MTLDDLIEHSFCVACYNADYDGFAEDFKKKLGVDKAPRMFRGFVFHVGFYPALGIWTNNVRHRQQFGCSVSHYAIIKYAQTMKWPYVCIFEDDALMVEGSREELETVITDTADSDIIRLEKMNTPEWVKKYYDYHDTITGHNSFNRGLWGAAAYIVMAKAYARLLDNEDVTTFFTDRDCLQDTAFAKMDIDLRAAHFFKQCRRDTYRKTDNVEDAFNAELDSLASTRGQTGSLSLSEKDFAFTDKFCMTAPLNQSVEVSPCCSIWHKKCYSGSLYCALLSLVKIGMTLGYTEVRYETSRGTYTVKAEDYCNVQKVPAFDLQGVEDLKGVTKE